MLARCYGALVPRRCAFIVLLISACSQPTPPTTTHGAVFFRDHVPGYQMVASREYTLSAFGTAWEHVDYLEATPTDDGEARLLDALRARAKTDTTIDVFFLSHGNAYDRWLGSLEAPVRQKLRLVYSTGAGGSAQGPAMVSLGARAYVGHRGGNVAPLFYRAFLKRWTKGGSLRKAVDDANTETKADVTGSMMTTVAKGLDAIGGPHLDPPRLWAGTEAQAFGDDSLTLR